MGITLDELLLDNNSAIKIQDTNGDELGINADGSIDVGFAPGAEIGITDGTDSLEINADGSINSVVTATDLDIRDLVNTQDSIAIGDETNLVDLEIADAVFAAGYGFSMYGVRRDADTSPVDADGDAHPFVFDDSGFLKVAGRISVEAGDAEYLEDSAHTSGDAGLHMLAVRQDVLATSTDADGDYSSFKLNALGRLYTTDSKNNSGQVASVSVGTTAVQLDATPLSNREEVTIQNEGNRDIYIGFSNTVTSANGLKISKNASASFKWGEGIEVWAISSTGTQDVRFAEVA